MKIRQKLSAFFVVVLLFTIFVLTFYAIFLMPDVINSAVTGLKEEVNDTEKIIVNALSLSEDFDETIKQLQINQAIIIVIEDIDGEVVYSKPKNISFDELSLNSNLYITSADNFFLNNSNGRQLYFINVLLPVSEQSDMNAFRDFSGMFIKRILLGSIITLILILTIFLFIITRVIVSPLEKLSDKIKSFRMSSSIAGGELVKGDEITQIHNDFDRLTIALDDEEKKQLRIIASISHDIKTPLTSIMGYAEQLRKNNVSTDRQAKYINTIYSKSIAIKDIIEGFDDYLSYDKKSPPDKEEVSVKQLLNTVKTYHSDDLEQKNVNLEMKFNIANEKMIIDESEILRVFVNLIDNSIKHKKDNVLVITIECKKRYHDILFCVSDNGEGVETEKLQKIFEPLYTSDESRTKNVSGLGLSICKEIVEAHGGVIWAENNSSGGLSVLFTIPALKSSEK